MLPGATHRQRFGADAAIGRWDEKAYGAYVTEQSLLNTYALSSGVPRAIDSAKSFLEGLTGHKVR